MKKLPFFRRPLAARRILEVGGGHDPYIGVTHSVDKYPTNNKERAHDLYIQPGVEFREGDLENLPFVESDSFDWAYLSHVFEHVTDPKKAVSEINRVAKAGYVATPSPLREQIACPYPFDSKKDFHSFFVWTSPKQKNTLHAIGKTQENIGTFCNCENGLLAKDLFHLRREQNINLEPIMPGISKETRLYFRNPLRLEIHSDFQSPCQAGVCAFQTAEHVTRWSRFPFRLFYKRFSKLSEVLKSIEK